MEFRNHSHVNLTDTRSRSLGLGLKFALQICNQPDDPDFNLKLYVKSGWNPPQEDPNLKESLYSIRQDVLDNFNKNKPRCRNNLASEERSGLREIKGNPMVRVFATDKKTLDQLSALQNG